MLKEKIFYFIIILFIGFLLIYLLNKPPTIVIKKPNIEKITSITFTDKINPKLCYGLKPADVSC
jgi:hypothetical protein